MQVWRAALAPAGMSTLNSKFAANVTPTTRSRRVIACGALIIAVLATSSPAFAKPAAADWMSKSAAFSNADIVNSKAGSLVSAVLAALPDTLDAQSVNILLVDKQGVSHVEVLSTGKAIYELQNGSEFSRRGAFNGTHEAVLKALVGAGSGGEAGGGYFGQVSAPASAGEKMVSDFISTREATDLVVTIGWTAKDGNFVYATLYNDRVEINADAPAAKK